MLHDLFLDRAFIAALNAPSPKLQKLKDPMQFVVSSMRMAYDGKTITNYRPAVAGCSSSASRFTDASRRTAIL